ncbi:MAG: hypothetical protein QG579_463 [Patescibacteria group bacterium]|nr:hypothetical protein [Patescibacteria group bacterium]
MSMGNLKIICLILLTSTVFLSLYVLSINKSKLDIEEESSFRLIDNDTEYTPNNTEEITEESTLNMGPVQDYLLKSGCDYSMSNNAYTNCAEDALNKIKEEKINDFKKLKELMNGREDNVLTSNQEENQKIYDWYDSSEKANNLRCLSSVFWTKAGSGYDGNLFRCEILETMTDIELINENYAEIKEWIDTMDII